MYHPMNPCTGRRRCMITEISRRYGNKAVTGAASETSARWLRRRHAVVELPDFVASVQLTMSTSGICR